MNDLPERMLSPVASQSRWLRSAASRRVAFVGLGVGAATLLGFGIYGVMHDKGIETKPADTGSLSISQTVQNPPDPSPVKVTHAEPPTPVVQVAAAVPPLPAVVQPPKPVFVIFPGGGSGEASFDVPQQPPQERPGSGAPAAGSAPGFGQTATTQVAFKPATLAGSKAGLAMRQTYLMMPQPINCRLDVALESTLSGPVFCSLTQDVMSPEHVILMWTGDHVTGTYKNEVHEGQHRLFAITATAFTKEGIPVPLEGQMADSLGRSGIAGDYDAHILERFGAAGALTAFQSATSLAQASLSKGGSNTYLNLNSGGGTEELASEILRSQIGIPPTISVPPGTIVSIMIDKPIDFSDALRVEARR